MTLGGLPLSSRRAAKVCQTGVVTSCGEGGDDIASAWRARPPPIEAVAVELARVAVEWRDAQKGGGLAPLHLAKLGHAHQEAWRRRCGRHARQGEEQPVTLVEVLMGLDLTRELGGQRRLEALPGRGSADVSSRSASFKLTCSREGL